MELNPGKSFLKQKIKELKHQAYEKIQEITKLKNHQPAHERWVLAGSIERLETEHKRLLARIRTYEFYFAPVGNSPGQKQGITDLDISRARGYPIAQLYNGKLRKSGTRLLGSCPFHSEKSASFVVYPEGKGWHCFGCGSGGSSIDYIMKRDNLKFLDAVKFLIKQT